MKKLLAGLLSLIMTAVVVATPLGENISNNWVNTSISASAKSSKKVSYKPYKAVINKYEKKYGKASIFEKYAVKGLCYAELIDLNSDGTKELLIAYGYKKKSKYGAYIDYSEEIWTIKSKKAKFVKKFNRVSVMQGYGPYLSHVKHGKYTYISINLEPTFPNVHYYKFDGKNLKCVKSIKWNPKPERYYIDGKRVTSKSYSKEMAKWSKGSKNYDFLNGYGNYYNKHYKISINDFKKVVNSTKSKCK